jgi:putative membrane protein
LVPVLETIAIRAVVDAPTIQPFDTVKSEPTAEDKKKYDELKNLSGKEFDRAFANAMVEGHKEAIAKFETVSKGNDDIAKFAQETLPTLRKHLKTAQSLG